MVPRGGADLIRRVKEEATVPAVTGGIGVCHTYVDASANIDKAVAIAYNAKVQRPSVCNALDTLLVHREIAPEYLPRIAGEWGTAGVEIRCDEEALAIMEDVSGANVTPAQESDWGQEFLALIASVKVVDRLRGGDISHRRVWLGALGGDTNRR